jgi:hypothetical protein
MAGALATIGLLALALRRVGVISSVSTDSSVVPSSYDRL